ncbi:hypothetical protein E2C01_021381 [Portunus trituberculatus]|uniref:Uncharacterized protein n=1 Tax=Portunus trituberculatus TaxID=210409 RepID=A0A5B7E4T4_PORTR|nr:hypothetical protein [Portunus trituberculatus]
MVYRPGSGTLIPKLFSCTALHIDMERKVQKHQHLFREFCDISVQLEQLEANQHESQSTRQTTHQLRCAAGTILFPICLTMIAKYSAMLEAVTQQLQAFDMDMTVVRDHIGLLMKAF